MKLFLASTFADSTREFMNVVPKRCQRVLFIDNAVDPLRNKSDCDWVKKDFDAFVNLGFNVTNYDMKDNSFKAMLNTHDIVHFCGGSAVYLLKLLKESGNDKILLYAIKSDKIFYTGTSAGSMICAPDISFCADDEDEQEAGMVGALKDLTALNLVPFYTMCHTQDPYYIPSTKTAMDRLPKNKIPLLFLRDGQAVYVNNNKLEIV